MATQIIISQNGPLPIVTTFQAPSDAPSTLMVAGSVYSTQGNGMIGVQVNLDGQVLGNPEIWANPPETHMAFVPALYPVTLQQGQHKIVLSANGVGCIGDLNDHYSVALFY